MVAGGFRGPSGPGGWGARGSAGFSPAPSVPTVPVVWHLRRLTLQPGQPTLFWSRDSTGLSRQKGEGIVKPRHGSGLGQATCIRGWVPVAAFQPYRATPPAQMSLHPSRREEGRGTHMPPLPGAGLTRHLIHSAAQPWSLPFTVRERAQGGPEKLETLAGGSLSRDGVKTFRGLCVQRGEQDPKQQRRGL